VPAFEVGLFSYGIFHNGPGVSHPSSLPPGPKQHQEQWPQAISAVDSSAVEKLPWGISDDGHGKPWETMVEMPPTLQISSPTEAPALPAAQVGCH